MGDTLAKKIHEYIDSQKDEILATLKRYIGFRSINTEQLVEGEKT